MLSHITDGNDEPGFNSGPPLLFNVVYCSRASADVTAATVDQIIETSRRNNRIWDITGMLVFGEGIFFQWLEGPRAHIKGLMKRLHGDDRHGQIIVLSEIEESSERLFPEWDMELVGADDIRVVLVDALEDDHQPHNIEALRGMLAEIDGRLGTHSAAP